MSATCAPAIARLLPGSTGFPYPPSCRLLRSVEFRQVYDQGTRFQTPLFAVFCLLKPDPAPSARIGFTTPRALGKAVARNRIKRRIREQVRLRLLTDLDPRWWLVFNPRRLALDAPVTDISAAIDKLRDHLHKRSSSSSADTSASSPLGSPRPAGSTPPAPNT